MQRRAIARVPGPVVVVLQTMALGEALYLLPAKPKR
jgi:hypothetical protein